MILEKEFRVIVVHGYTSSPQKDWHPNLARELERRGIEYAIPALPGGENPHREEWLAAIDAEVKKSKKPLVLIGHSLGTRAVLLYLDVHQISVEAAILVAPFDNDPAKKRNEHYADFFVHAVDIGKVKIRAKRWVVLHSKDDRAISYEQGVALARELGAEFISYENKDHFHNAEDYIEVLKALDDTDHHNDFKKTLTSEEYHIMRKGGTELPFSGKYVHIKDKGVYVCKACGNELFSSADKFDSGTGWPSFDRPVAEGKITLHKDESGGTVRTEARCGKCGSHLGHVFDDGPRETTGKRYCINSVCLKLKKKK